MKTHRIVAFAVAMLITAFLVRVLADRTIAVSTDQAHVAATAAAP